MLTTVTKHKYFEKNCWHNKTCYVCSVESVGKPNAIAMQASLFNSMKKKSSNYTNTLVKEATRVSFHPKTVYLTVIFRFQIHIKPIVRL